jgi:hypothetical protein
VFYLLLAAIPVLSAGALGLFARLLEAAKGGPLGVASRLQMLALAAGLAALVLAAAISSPLT